MLVVSLTVSANKIVKSCEKDIFVTYYADAIPLAIRWVFLGFIIRILTLHSSNLFYRRAAGPCSSK